MQSWKQRPATRRGEAGFSMIEALIAAAILLIIALGLLPLFSRAINDNVSGNDATQATNASKTQVEALMQLPIDNQRLAIPGGGTNETKDYWTAGDTSQLGDADEGWQTDTTGHGAVLWNRTTRVTQLTLADLDTTGLNKDAITLRQIEVEVDNPKQNLFGNGQGITLHMIKYD